MPAYIGLYHMAGEGGRSHGERLTLEKNFARGGGGRTLLLALVSESAVRIEKFERLAKFLFLAHGHI